MTISRILVATDGSDTARRAMEFASEMAQTADATVVAVHVFEPLALLGHVAPPVDFASHEADAARVLQEVWCAPLAAAGVSFTSTVVEGAPVAAIADLARSTGADLIVVGSRGLSEARKLLVGSTSSGLLHEAGIPVVVVPPASGPGPVAG